MSTSGGLEKEMKMKLKETFISHEIAGKLVTVDFSGESFNGIIRSNPTAAYIIGQLQKGCSREELIDRMDERYEAPRDVIAKDVDRVLDQLRKIQALEE